MTTTAVTSLARRARAALALGILAAATGAACAGTLADSIANTPQLSTLNSLLHSGATVDMFQAAGPYTVFAPSNDAFKALPAKTLEDLKEHPETLRNVLSYHVVNGKLTATDVKTGKVKSLQGSELEVSRSGDFITVESAVVVTPDQTADNGVLHVIDTVLMPPVKK